MEKLLNVLETEPTLEIEQPIIMCTTQNLRRYEIDAKLGPRETMM